MERILIILLIVFSTSLGIQKKVPNIVLIMVDDMGIGDIPCFGNTSVPMPNVAKLCKEGTKLTHHTTPAIFCTPSRTAFLTGRYHVRSGMVGSAAQKNSPPVVMYAGGTAGLPSNETSFAKVLKKAGYTTGVVGKWHLGLNQLHWGDMKHGPLGHGFDYFYGLPFTLVDGFEDSRPFFTFYRAELWETLMPLVALFPFWLMIKKRFFYILFLATAFLSWFQAEHFALTKAGWWQRSLFMEKFLNSYLMENYEVVEKPIKLESLTEKLTNKSLQFLEKSAISGQPFLLFHSFAAVHTPLVAGPAFEGASVNHGAYGDKLIEVDHTTGLILEKIRSLGLESDTLVYFTSDHGADIEIGRNGGFNGLFRGGKGNAALEGGMRIPGIIKWPGVVKANSVVESPTSLMDILPTLADIAGVDTQELKLDGQSLLSALKDSAAHLASRRPIFHFCESDIFAMRVEHENTSYKMVFKSHNMDMSGLCGRCSCYHRDVIKHSPPLLYNLDEDPSELSALDVASPKYQDMVQRMQYHLKVIQDDLGRTAMSSQFNSWALLPRPWLQPLVDV